MVCGPWFPVAVRQDPRISLSLSGEEQGHNVDFFLVPCPVAAGAPHRLHTGPCLLCALSLEVFSPQSCQPCTPARSALSARWLWSRAPFARARAFAVPLSPFHSRWDGQEPQQSQNFRRESAAGGRLRIELINMPTPHHHHSLL